MGTEAAANKDQANGLRTLNKNKPVQVVAVTAGKGGVGKTNISVNLAIALSKQDKNVLLLDADLALANIDILLGIHPRKNLLDVLEQRCSLEDIIIDGPCNVKVIPSSTGTEMMANLNAQEHAGIIQAFSDLTIPIDTLIIDTAAGISETVMNFTQTAHKVLVVVCDEPTSITDAYALIKVMSHEYGIHNFEIVTNMVRNKIEGMELFHKLVRVSDRFLDVHLEHLGSVSYDDYLKKAVKHQRAVVDEYPSAKSASEFRAVAKKMLSWEVSGEMTGNMGFFMERLAKQNAADAKGTDDNEVNRE
jgi:flagellar biosynthesis protein FlhG